MQQNKMAVTPMGRLIWRMGLPMIVSMVLQALYNVVDSVFVSNMGPAGAMANHALTLASPIQILMIAVGVGTGVGINALLSRSLGQGDRDKVNRVAGTGIFLSLCLYAVFLLFGLVGAKRFISLFADGDGQVAALGTTYLRICTFFSLGAIGFTVYERFLQATGKTLASTLAQISGALTNVLLDYVFIYPLDMGVAGAAWATVIGQFVSLFAAMALHYTSNREIDGHPRYIRPNWALTREIYGIGISAALMQALLAVMMAGVNAILEAAPADSTVLVGSFGIYYKIQQIPLFAAFGLSNTIISVLSFQYGMGEGRRALDCVRWGITDTLAVCLGLSVLLEVFARPLASLFGLTGGSNQEMIGACATALRIASLGYCFMGVTVAVQGVLQSLEDAVRPLVLALLRLVVFVFPLAWVFSRTEQVLTLVWWTFPIAEVLTAAVAAIFLRRAVRNKLRPMVSGQ